MRHRILRTLLPSCASCSEDCVKLFCSFTVCTVNCRTVCYSSDGCSVQTDEAGYHILVHKSAFVSTEILVICDVWKEGSPYRLHAFARSAHTRFRSSVQSSSRHLILVVCRKHALPVCGYLSQDTSSSLPVKSTSPASSLWNVADAVSHLATSVSFQCVRRIYK